MATLAFYAAAFSGEKLFQIQTYGSKGRNASAKQTIQFDKQRAAELIDILKREFGL